MKIKNVISIILIVCVNSCASSNKVIETTQLNTHHFNDVPCNGTVYQVKNELVSINNFSTDIIYNLNWADSLVLNNKGRIFFKDFLVCQVLSSNDGNIESTENLKRCLNKITSLLPDFTLNDYLELDVFLVDVINKIDNDYLLESILPFAKITKDPDKLFPSSHGSIQKYGLTVINGIIKKQSLNIRNKYRKLKQSSNKLSYEEYHNKLLHQLLDDYNNGIISLQRVH